MAEQDLSRIVSLIMENPDLIAQIKSLGESHTASEEKQSTEPTKDSKSISEPKTENTSADSEKRTAGIEKQRRKELLCALKPYVSEKRSHAIDSMISIADILDMMKSR